MLGSIYGLKQVSRSWNLHFDETIKTYGFQQNVDEPCVYKYIKEKKVVFLVLYVDDILLIGNDVETLSNVKKWLAEQFQMKDLGEASYILGIQIIKDRKNKLLALSQASYIDKVLAQFSMQDSKKGILPTRHGIILSKEQCPKTPQEEEDMRRIPYDSAVGSLMYVMLCTRPDICYAVGIVSGYQSNPGMGHWIALKNILKYLRRMRDYMLVYCDAQNRGVSLTIRQPGEYSWMSGNPTPLMKIGQSPLYGELYPKYNMSQSHGNLSQCFTKTTLGPYTIKMSKNDHVGPCINTH